MPHEARTALLTGGAGTIGTKVAELLVADGWRVTVIDRVRPTLATVAHIGADLGSLDQVQALARTLGEQPCDALINLAGIQYFGPVNRQDPTHIVATYIVNLITPVLLSQAVIPGMQRRQHGHIVNIGSIFGSINFAHFVTYSSSKAGLRGFSEALRRELAGTGVDVTYIAPRAVKTALNSDSVMKFAAATKMSMDDPLTIARKIVSAIAGRRKDVYIGFPESLFVRVNALMPRLVDRALAANDRAARQMFQS